jgi:hypothetical protein
MVRKMIPKEKRNAKARLITHLKALNNLLIEEEVAEYIRKCDEAALHGIVDDKEGEEEPPPPAYSYMGPPPPDYSYIDPCAQISAIFLEYHQVVERGGDVIAVRPRYIDSQCALYGKRTLLAVKPGKEVTEVRPRATSLPPPFLFLLCSRSLKSRDSLTRHTKNVHRGVLYDVHCCPRCGSRINAGSIS